MFIAEPPFDKLKNIDLLDIYTINDKPVLYKCRGRWHEKDGFKTNTLIGYLQVSTNDGETYVFVEVKKEYIEQCEHKIITIEQLFKKGRGSVMIVGFPYKGDYGIYSYEMAPAELGETDIPCGKVYLDHVYQTNR